MVSLKMLVAAISSSRALKAAGVRPLISPPIDFTPSQMPPYTSLPPEKLKRRPILQPFLMARKKAMIAQRQVALSSSSNEAVRRHQLSQQRRQSHDTFTSATSAPTAARDYNVTRAPKPSPKVRRADAVAIVEKCLAFSPILDEVGRSELVLRT